MKIGIIGGSGLYSLFDEGQSREHIIDTPFGSPSDAFVTGMIEGHEAVFLPRHGRHHHLMPYEVNYKANVYGMKHFGVDLIVSMSAVGSLKLEYKPRDVVLVDQFFDRTTKRPQTFYGGGLVAHASLAEPVCPFVHKEILTQKSKLPVTLHDRGTYVNMEGPQFSTKAESEFHRRNGFDVVGMTNLSEARLAREAEICYSALSFITDYDCWHESEEAVTVDQVIAVLKDNADNAKAMVKILVKHLSAIHEWNCPCQHAMKFARLTADEKIPPAKKAEISLLLNKYF